MTSVKFVSTSVLLASLLMSHRAVQAQQVPAAGIAARADEESTPLEPQRETSPRKTVSDSSRTAESQLANPDTESPDDVPAWLLNGSPLGSGVLPRQAVDQVDWITENGLRNRGEVGCSDDILQAHRSGIIGEFLYLHPGNIDVPYATPMDGMGPTAVPTGPSCMASPTYQPGFRLGLNANLTDASSLSANYWFYQGQSTHSRTLSGGSGFLNADLVHPNTTSVAVDSLSARADYDMDFDIIDLQYRTTLREEAYLMYLTFGARYARLDEDFHARYSMLGTTHVVSDIGFDGLGPRLGLEIEKALDGDFHMYVRGGASLLLGNFNANYRQTNIFSGTQATAGFDDNRLVPVTELELGLGWTSATETFRFAAGYYIGSWFNTVTTGSFIGGVQDGTLYSVGGLGDTLIFDGLVARIEVRY